MVASVMQPTVWPWAGLFALIDASDVFVSYDVAAIDTKSWQTRNRIRARDGQTIWLSIPNNGKQGMPLNEVEVKNGPWTNKHRRSIHAAYSHAPYWNDLAPIVDDFCDRPFTTLAAANTYAIKRVCQYLGIETPMGPASRLGQLRADRIGRIVDTCKAVSADVLLDVRGATFLEDADLEGIELRWFDYEPAEYAQGGMPWQSHLSILDLIAWQGPMSLEIIRQGTRPHALQNLRH